MPVIPMLKIDYPLCQACKVNQSVPVPGGAYKTMNSVILKRNKVQLAYPFMTATISTSKSEASASLKTKLINRKHVKSILRRRISTRLPLKCSESLFLSGSFVHMDYVFCETVSVRGLKQF